VIWTVAVLNVGNVRSWAMLVKYPYCKS